MPFSRSRNTTVLTVRELLEQRSPVKGLQVTERGIAKGLVSTLPRRS